MLPQKTNSCETYVVKKIILPCLQGSIFGNQHIFVNSVDFISKVIKIAELSPDDVKIVCALNPLNQKKLGDDYFICKPLDPVKKINFYTATCFEGSDVLDEEGRTYIVSDKKRQHTLLDISTLAIQICGRIRNSIYNDSVTHIFSGKKYDRVNLAEYRAVCLDKYTQSLALADKLNNFSEVERLKLNNMVNNLGKEYMRINENNTFEADENLFNLDIMNFKIHQLVYQNKITIAGEYQRQGFEVSSSKYTFFAERLMADSNAKISFKDLFCQYVDLKNLSFGQGLQEVKLIEQERPLIKEAYNKLGIERVTQLNFHQGNIKKEIIKIENESNLWKTTKMIMEKIGFLNQIEIVKAKKYLREIYTELGIRKKAKSTDLNKLFYTKQTIKNSVRYIELLQTKMAALPCEI